MQNIDRLDAIIEPLLDTARIPGAALAIVADGKIVFAKGYGYRNLEAKLPLNSDTVYPIGSTTKAINATVVGMLVDEGRLAWDEPVQTYLPRFRLRDPFISTQVTLRDLLAMRTGLPRHDWLWLENPIGRAELVERIQHLELSAGFRERFQYNNLMTMTAGHIAEIVSGQNWVELVQQRILSPLGMGNTGFGPPTNGNVTLSYHENGRRELILTKGFSVPEVGGPAGGLIHSTIEDMALWMLFNLSGGKVDGRQLIQPETLTEIQSPQMLEKGEPPYYTPNSAYAMGWSVDTYNGRARVSHGGYLHDVNSEVMLFPKEGIGIVSFVNFGSPRIAKLINQYVFDLMMDLKPAQTLEETLAQYEKQVEETRVRNASARRVENTSPSHALTDYAGVYMHAGYGEIEIRLSDERLTFHRNNLVLPLEHWHYDAWMAAENELFEIHYPHVFDRASPLLFDTSADGEIAALSIGLEAAVAPIRFLKQSVASK
jgi:CubicO group peptidase (beta-lactamase class C family)